MLCFCCFYLKRVRVVHFTNKTCGSVVGVKPGNMGGVDLPGIILAQDAGGPETSIQSIYSKK